MKHSRSLPFLNCFVSSPGNRPACQAWAAEWNFGLALLSWAESTQVAFGSLRAVQVAFGMPLTHATGHQPQLVILPIIGATGTTMDFGLSNVRLLDFGLKLNANSAGLEKATDRANGVRGFGGGGGIFLPGDPVPVRGWLVGALLLALASGKLSTPDPDGMFAKGAMG